MFGKTLDLFIIQSVSMHGSRAKKIHESYMHGSFCVTFCCAFAITASWMLVTVLNIPVKKTELNLCIFDFLRPLNHLNILIIQRAD